MNVFKSDAVIWWAAIFRTSSSMFDKLLHLSKSQGSSMSRLRSHDLREPISKLLTVTMHLQDVLSKFHRPGLQEVDLRVHVDSHPCVSRITVHNTIVPGGQLHISHPLVSRCVTLASSTNQCHQLGLTRTQANHVLFLGRRVHKIPRVFNGTLDPNCNSRAAATISDISSTLSVGHSPRPNFADQSNLPSNCL